MNDRVLIRSISILLAAVFLLAACSSFVLTPTPLPVKLRFAYIGEESVYRALAEQYHTAHANITIELVPVSLERGGLQPFYDEINQADAVRATISYLGADQVDLLSPLDAFITADTNFKPDNYFPGSLEALSYQGKQLGIPAGLNPFVMFYENSRFRIAEVAPLDSNYTLGEFVAVAQKVNEQDPYKQSEGKFSYGFCTYPQSTDAVIFTYLFGGGLTEISGDLVRPTLNRPENVEAMTWYTRLWTEYAIAPPVSANPGNFYLDLSGATCAFWILPYDMYGLKKSLTIEPRMLPLPQVNAPFSLATIDGYFIPKKSAHPQEAWQWIRFLTSHQEASLDQVPPLKSEIASEVYAQRVGGDALGIARELGSDTIFFGFSLSFDTRQNEIIGLYLQAIQQIIEEHADVQSALDAAQREAENLTP